MITPQIIIQSTVLGTSVPTDPYFTCPVHQQAQITKFTLFNYSALAVTVDFYLVPSGQTIADTWKRAMAQPVAPGQSMDLSGLRQLMQPGDFLTGLCSAADSCTVKTDANIIT